MDDFAQAQLDGTEVPDAIETTATSGELES
jgi:hypothetical protein